MFRWNHLGIATFPEGPVANPEFTDLQVLSNYVKNNTHRRTPRFFQTTSKITLAGGQPDGFELLQKLLQARHPQDVLEILSYYFKNKTQMIPEILLNYLNHQTKIVSDILSN